jgi:hypothetical protein
LNNALVLGTGFAEFTRKVSLNMIPTSRLAPLTAVFCAVMLAFSQNARAHSILPTMTRNLSIGVLSAARDGIPNSRKPGSEASTAYVNHLISMALGTTDVALGQIFHRSNNDFGPLPSAVFDRNGVGKTIDLGAGGLYSYLFVNYNGRSHATEIWYVGNLSGIIRVPATPGKHGISGWTLFGLGVGVPDGGATVMLLGVALCALGMARRFLVRLTGSSVPTPRH